MSDKTEQGLLLEQYEIFQELARADFDGDLAGAFLLTAGSPAEAEAAWLSGAVVLTVASDAAELSAQERTSSNLDEAVRWVRAAQLKGEAARLGLLGDIEQVAQTLLERGVIPDLVSPASWSEGLQRHGSIPARFERSCKHLTFQAALGNRRDIELIDQYLLEFFSEQQGLIRWIKLAAKYLTKTELPARSLCLEQLDQSKVALAVNQFVADGILKAPIRLFFDEEEGELLLDGSKAAEEELKLALESRVELS